MAQRQESLLIRRFCLSILSFLPPFNTHFWFVPCNLLFSHLNCTRLLHSLDSKSMESSYAPLIKKSHSNADTCKNLYGLVLTDFAQAKSVLACVAGSISMGVLYCYGGGATRRVAKSQFGFSFHLCFS